MLPDNKKADSWRKNLKFISHCPVCGRDYKLESCKLLTNEAEAGFIHFTCDYCRSNFMAKIIIMPKGISTVGMVTDLNFKDVQRLRQMPSIIVDEIIEAHKFIHSPDFKI
jgi:hypothetical protein